MNAHAERVRRDNIAESKRQVADALESMSDTALLQDRAIEGIGKAAREGLSEAKKQAAVATDEALVARSDAADARQAVHEVDRRLEAFKNQTLAQRFMWFMRGPQP